MPTVKARKGDFVAWEHKTTIAYQGRPSTTSVRWRLGLVARTNREGVAQAAIELGSTAHTSLDGKDRRLSSAKTLDLEGLAAAYKAAPPLATLADVRDLVRPFVRRS